MVHLQVLMLKKKVCHHLSQHFKEFSIYLKIRKYSESTIIWTFFFKKETIATLYFQKSEFGSSEKLGFTNKTFPSHS